MKTLIAGPKGFRRHPPGGTFVLPAGMARAVVALGLAAYAPPPKPKAPAKAAPPKGTYARRDMTAEVRGTITQPAATLHVPSGYAYPLTKPDDGKA